MRNATQVTVSTMGAIMALAGIEHGIGEILQGNQAPNSLMISSWPDSEFFRSLAGEPAITIVPNFLATGILAVFFSLLYLLWATRFMQRKHAGLVMMLLSIAMLVVGGGIFPPVLALLIGALATRINASLTWWRTHFSISLRRFCGKIWPWSFAACLSGWLLLFPGVNILGYFFGVNEPSLTVLLIFFAVGSLLVTILTGFARSSSPSMIS